jgi:hypothetical protein
MPISSAAATRPPGPQRLLRRAFEHPLLKPGQHLIRQHIGGFGDRPRLQLADPPVQQQAQRARESGTQLLGVLQLGSRRLNLGTPRTGGRCTSEPAGH